MTPADSYTILHIEDNKSDALFLSKTLARHSTYKFSIHHEANLENGLALLRMQDYDVVLLDLGLPEIEGLDGLAEICKQFPNACIVVLTGFENFKLSQQAIAIGAQDYINKADISEKILVKTITHAYERNQLITHIKERESLLSNINKVVGSGIFKLFIEGPDQYRFMDVNEAYAEKIYKKPDDIIGKRLDEIIPEESIPDLLAEYRSALTKGHKHTFEFSILTSKGRNYGLVTVTPTFNIDGKAETLIGSIQDTTEVRQKEEEIEKRDSYLRAIYRHSQFAITLSDAEGYILEANPAAAQLFGYSRRELTGMNFAEIQHVHMDSAQVKAAYTSYVLEGEEMGTYHFYDKSGEEKRALYSARMVDENTSLCGFIDITDKHFYEKENERLSLIAEQTINGAVITDDEGYIQWVNESFSRITGYKSDEVLGQKPGDMLQGPETSASAKHLIGQSIKNRQSFDVEILNYRKDGKKYWNHIQGQPLMNKNAEPNGFFALQTDITERKLKEEELRKISEKLNWALDFSNIGIFDWLVKHDEAEVFGSYYSVIGYQEHEFCPGKDFLKIVHPEDLDQVKRVMDGFKDGNKSTAELTYRIIDAQGNVRWLLDQIHTQYDEGGDLHVIGLVRDVTKKLESEKALMEATINGQEEERRRISKEIHDGLQQTLLSALLNFRSVQKRVKKGEEQEKILSIFDRGIDLLSDSLEKTRNIAHDLMPSDVKGKGLKALLEESSRDLKGHFEVNSHFEQIDITLPEELILGVYRIYQECISNIIKHAKATTISLGLAIRDNILWVEIEDDGKGFNKGEAFRTNGMLSMHNRAKLLGGVLAVNSALREGTQIILKVPVGGSQDDFLMTERNLIEDMLKANESQYRSIFDYMAQEVHFWKLVRNEDGEIATWQLVDANPPALKAWGKPRKAVVGKTTNDIFEGTNPTALFMPIVQKIFETGEPYSWETYFDATGQHLYMTSIPLGEYFVTTGVDITDSTLIKNKKKQ